MRLEVLIDKLVEGNWTATVTPHPRTDMTTRIFAPDTATLTSLVGQCVVAHVEMWTAGQYRR